MKHNTIEEMEIVDEIRAEDLNETPVLLDNGFSEGAAQDLVDTLDREQQAQDWERWSEQL